MPSSPEEMAATMIANLKDKTGKSLPQWLKLTKASGLDKHGQIVKMLKTDHGITHGFANLIAHKSLESGSGKPASGGGDPLVDAQYAGGKAELRPIYDAVVAAARKLGKDVEISPKKSYVSLRRSKQFALIQPSTRTRVDLGLQLNGAKAFGKSPRLESSGSFNQMVSHRVRLEKKGDVDAELKKWLRRAYDNA